MDVGFDAGEDFVEDVVEDFLGYLLVVSGGFIWGSAFFLAAD